MFETSRARQLLQRGQLADAVAAVEGRFRPEDAHLVVSVPDADAVVVLGRAALHTADQQQAELTSAIAQRMLTSGVPGVERHAAWLLALQAHAAGDPAQARRWLATRGEQERLSVFPLVPLDPSEPAARPDRHRQRGHGAGRVGGGSRRAAARDQSRRTLRRGQRRARPRPAHRDAALLARAVGILEAGQRPLALASALEDLAVAETRQAAPTRPSPHSTAPSSSTPTAGPAGTSPGSAGGCGSSGSGAAWPLSPGPLGAGPP